MSRLRAFDIAVTPAVALEYGWVWGALLNEYFGNRGVGRRIRRLRVFRFEYRACILRPTGTKKAERVAVPGSA